MDQKFKDELRNLFNIAVGAAAVGAEKTKAAAEKLARRGKEEWDNSAPKRAELKEKIAGYKQQFYDKINKDKDAALTLDQILENLDKLSDEELEKLKEILKNIGKDGE